MGHLGARTYGVLLVTAGMLAAACSGGSSHSTGTPAPKISAAPTSGGQSPGSTPSKGSNGYGTAQSIQTSDGYQYSVAVSKFSLVTQPTGLEPAPPGKDYLSFSILATNPLSDRDEPITAFDRGAGQPGLISVGAPLGDPAFDCSPTSFSTPPTLATSPPVCDTNHLTVSSDTAQDTGTIAAKSAATIVYVTDATVPANIDLSQLKIYYAPPGGSSPPMLLSQPS